jgi:Ulp1 family protease
MRVSPNKDNSLLSHSAEYLSKVGSQNKDSHATKGFIVLEMRSGALLDKLFEWMRDKEALSAFVADENKSIDEQECEQYALTMLSHIEEEADAAPSRKKRKTRKSAKAKSHNNNNKVMLVFPFGEDEEKIDSAAENLNEAKWVIEQATTLKVDDGDRGTCSDLEDGMSRVHIDSCESESNIGTTSGNVSDEGNDSDRVTSLSGAEGEQGSDSDANLNSKPIISGDSDQGKPEEGGVGEKAEPEKKTRAHFLTIRQEDFDRLDDGEFLNDTLIDFWMQW